MESMRYFVINLRERYEIMKFHVSFSVSVRGRGGSHVITLPLNGWSRNWVFNPTLFPIFPLWIYFSTFFPCIKQRKIIYSQNFLKINEILFISWIQLFSLIFEINLGFQNCFKNWFLIPCHSLLDLWTFCENKHEPRCFIIIYFHNI